MRLCSKVKCYMLRDHIRATFGKKRGTVQLLVNCAGMSATRRLGQRSMPVLERCKCKYEKICARSVDTTNAARQLCAARGETDSKKCLRLCWSGRMPAVRLSKKKSNRKRGKELQMEKGDIYTLWQLCAAGLCDAGCNGQEGCTSLLEPGLVDTEQAAEVLATWTLTGIPL